MTRDLTGLRTLLADGLEAAAAVVRPVRGRACWCGMGDCPDLDHAAVMGQALTRRPAGCSCANPYVAGGMELGCELHGLPAWLQDRDVDVPHPVTQAATAVDAPEWLQECDPDQCWGCGGSDPACPARRDPSDAEQ